MLRNRMVDLVALLLMPLWAAIILIQLVKNAAYEFWLEMNIEWESRKTYYSVKKEATDGK